MQQEALKKQEEKKKATECRVSTFWQKLLARRSCQCVVRQAQSQSQQSRNAGRVGLNRSSPLSIALLPLRADAAGPSCAEPLRAL